MIELELRHLKQYPMCEDTGLLIRTNLRKATQSGRPLGYYTGRLIGVSTRGSEVEIVIDKDDFAQDFDLSEVKPILRPLSDLPSHFINSEHFEGWQSDWVDHVADFQEKIHEANILACPYDLMQDLLSNHFDVFNLIEKGLAIDINKIDQQPLNSRG